LLTVVGRFGRGARNGVPRSEYNSDRRPMIDEEANGDGLSFLGRLPFGRWTEIHGLLTKRARSFLASFEASDRRDFEQRLDGFLASRAHALGCQRLRGPQHRWILPSEHGTRLLSDVHLFATSFTEGTEWEELRSLMRDIRPIMKAGPKTKRAASNEPLAFTVLLMLLADRAARSFDGEALEKADAILSEQAGALCVLAWHGADAFENVDRLRAQAPKASAARTQKAEDERQLIRGELQRLRLAGTPKRQAAKQAAAALKQYEVLKALKFENLVRRCEKVKSAEFTPWEQASPGKNKKTTDP
jgi:hypothetical protein